MRNSKKWGILAAVITGGVVGVYFIRMYFVGYTSVSNSVQDWGALGSYIGGFLAPLASLFAALLIYKNLQLDTYQKRLDIARDNIGRFDEQLFKSFDVPFYNNILGSKYYGKPFIDIINAVSNGDIQSNEEFNEALLALIQNVGILNESVVKYLKLLKEFDGDTGGSSWIVETEHHYWIQKYNAKCRRIIKILGKEQVKERLSGEQFKALELILLLDLYNDE